MSSQVSLATPIWQHTYPYMLGPEGMLARNLRMLRDVDFADVMVLVNNGVPLDPENILKQWIPRTWLRYIKSDVAVRTMFREEGVHLDKGDVPITNISRGFWYSAGPLAAIAMCKTPYLLFIADDVELVRSEPGWVQHGIDCLQAHEGVMCVTPMWHKTRSELIYEHPENYGFFGAVMTRGFSDHAFLIRVADFRKAIYDEINAESDVLYPIDGAFEKRIGAYMRNHGKYRMVLEQAQWKHESYGHAGNGRRPKPTIPMPHNPDYDR